MKAVIADTNQKILLCEYLKERVDADIDPAMSQGFAFMSDDMVFAGAVMVSNVRYHKGKAIDCEVSLAAETPAAWRPGPCRAVFTYVFETLGCVRCTAIVRKNNTKARKHVEGFNFVLEGNIRKGYDGEKDALVYGLLREDCTFLGDLSAATS